MFYIIRKIRIISRKKVLVFKLGLVLYLKFSKSNFWELKNKLKWYKFL